MSKTTRISKKSAKRPFHFAEGSDPGRCSRIGDLQLLYVLGWGQKATTQTTQMELWSRNSGRGTGLSRCKRVDVEAFMGIVSTEFRRLKSCVVSSWKRAARALDNPGTYLKSLEARCNGGAAQWKQYSFGPDQHWQVSAMQTNQVKSSTAMISPAAVVDFTPK